MHEPAHHASPWPPRGAARTRIQLGSAAFAFLLLVVLAALWAVTFERINFERDGDIAEATRQNSNLARVLEEHTVQTIAMADAMLQALKRDYQLELDHFDAARWMERQALDSAIFAFAGVTDARGNLASGASPANVSDRDYFEHHRVSDDPGLHIGAPIHGRVTGHWVIPVSRRVNRADGRFAGVVVAGIDARYLTRLYDQFELGTGGVVQLVGLDGVLRARRTATAAASGDDMKQSTLLRRAAQSDADSFLSTGRLDGVPRFMSYRVLRSQGLVIAVGRSSMEVLAPSQARRGLYLAGSALGTVLVIAFSIGLAQARRRQQRAALAASASAVLYRVTYEQAAVGIAHSALDGRFLRANRRFCEICGYREDELLGLRFQDLIPAGEAPGEAEMSKILEAGVFRAELHHVRKDGRMIWVSVDVAVVRDAAGRPDYFVAMVQDVSERRQAQDLLLYQAHHDTLTGLPNRTLLLDRIGNELQHARRNDRKVAVMFVDLDRFKLINESCGHETGNLVLREVAARLTAAVRAEDTVARVGGDEFVIVLRDVVDNPGASRVARQLVSRMEQPFTIGASELFVTASVGIAVFPGDGADAEALIRNADAAMSHAKQRGRDTFHFYAAALNRQVTNKLRMERSLRHALERDEFRIHLQPKVGITDGRVKGFEALLRWQNGTGAPMSPARFVPLLEESGMIVAVGEWVLRSACAQIRTWQNAGLQPLPIAVNVSARQFLYHDLFEVVDRPLRDHAVPGPLLELEITETDAMREPERATEILRRLQARGVRIAIDDFGTGYSSLAYLKRFPIQVLKIDRSFISSLPHDTEDAAIAQAVIVMAHSLGLEVVAEGVETEAQRAFLQARGCDQMQGYLYSRPLAATDCAQFLDRATTATSTPEEVAA